MDDIQQNSVLKRNIHATEGCKISHFIFVEIESEMLSRGVTRFAPRVVSQRLAHTDKHFPDLSYYRREAVPARPIDFMDAQLEEKEHRKAHVYTLNAVVVSSATWMVANFVCKAINVLNPSQDVLAMATVELELDSMGVGKTHL